MEIKTNGGEYNPCQYSLTTNLSPDSKILSKSEMYVVRGETPEEVHKAFQKLQRLINNGESKLEKKVKNNPEKEKKQSKKEEKKDNSGTCPKCGAVLVHRSGISRNGVAYNFLGCSSFPICSYTRNIPEKEPLPIADQDLINVEEVPF